MSRVVHFEVPANDLDRAVKFYSTVFNPKTTEPVHIKEG